ncbi:MULTISPECIES: ABC transporter permease [Chelatococcus]|uniref:Peptide/nickel transport system permease protein n=1 Tax=Chelatococcus caeni TaxID=1348468 RepID=A0A840C4V9_9HYPH|nr:MULTISPECIES: ABC transporter permease [unclassified Chelatococcus]ALA16938.1 ABC transporter permease [Chelatococcus sp. CO-6]MBB4017437.1 peptide/nickel transport system permease protein [Chelatococcus caeni]
MRRFLLARLAQAGLVALVVGTLSFALMRALPGDAAMRIAAGRYGPDAMTGQAADKVRLELGLDRPWPAQFLDWLETLARLDLGHSLVTGAPVIEELKVQLGASLWLAAAALLISLAIGPVAGVLAGLRPTGWADRLGLAASVSLRAVPPFVLGLVLILVFAIWLGWLPPAGFGTARDLVLPALTLALGLAAVSSRVTRDAVAAVARAPHFAFARHKGLPEAVVVRRHGLRNAAIPVVSYLGLQAIYLVEGVVVVESLFAYPGIGHALVHAIVERDIPMVQGTALAMGLIFVAVTACVDAASAWLDPRLRSAR